MRTKSILAVMLMSIIVMQSFTVMANTIRKEVVVGEETPAAIGAIPLLGWVAAGVAAVLGGMYVATRDDGTCSPSPMCNPSYCTNNRAICDLFTGKTVDCCNGRTIIIN